MNCISFLTRLRGRVDEDIDPYRVRRTRRGGYQPPAYLAYCNIDTTRMQFPVGYGIIASYLPIFSE